MTYRLALLVLAPVQNGPVDLPGVPLGQESRFALGIQKLEHLKKDRKMRRGTLPTVMHSATHWHFPLYINLFIYTHYRNRPTQS